ncbi:MAG: pantetheine-phosphate adenylyltransferase [Actinomycetaceae bacterium]|nr:pantetheine-phosphate adenylyltransferase [Actinomycetaceae bacterium]
MASAAITGTFDPPTLGHIDIISRAATMFQSVTVIVGTNINKTPLFTVSERVELLHKCLNANNVRTIVADGLTATVVSDLKIDAIVKGIRGATDTEYELTQARLNRELGGVETLLIPTNPAYSHISSSAVKEIAHFGGDITKMVPDVVARALSERINHE